MVAAEGRAGCFVVVPAGAPGIRDKEIASQRRTVLALGCGRPAALSRLPVVGARFRPLARAAAVRSNQNCFFDPALATPELIREGAEKFGAQCIVVSIDAKKTGPEEWRVFSHGGRKETGLEAVAWAKEAVELGSGEIVLNSIDADGTKAGYDIEITRRISENVGVPVVASGGAGNLDHMVDVLKEGKADAVLAASIFHFGEYTVGEVKEHLAKADIPVRLV